MLFKAAIFDLDGTLIDSMSVWDGVGADFLAEHGITPPHNIDKILKPMSFCQSAAYFLKEYEIDYTPDEIMQSVYEKASIHYKNTIPLKLYTKQYLDYLKINNIKMCIATASNKELAVHALTRLGVLDYFEFIITCDEVGVAKDQPAIYLNAADLLGFSPREIAVFEDALYCAKTAKKAGFTVIGVYDESSYEDRDCLQNTCDLFIENFSELLEEDKLENGTNDSRI